MKYSWFNNPTFRRAVSLAIDREAMIPSVFFGEAVKNWAIATPGNKVWHSPDLLKYDYNPGEAKKLLAGMGWKDGNGDGIIEDARGNPVTFSLKTNSSNTMRIAMMNFIKADLAKVGINVITAPVDFNTLITNLRSDFQYEAMLLGLQSGVPPDPTMMQNVWRSTGLTHSWFLTQAKPDTPQEARIDHLMDVIIGTHDLAGASESLQGSRDDRQRDGVDDMAAGSRAENPGEQPVRQHPAQRPPTSDSVELHTTSTSNDARVADTQQAVPRRSAGRARRDRLPAPRGRGCRVQRSTSLAGGCARRRRTIARQAWRPLRVRAHQAIRARSTR